MAESPSADVVVIGAGCAGLSAGVRLAARGLKVTVLEESPRLGGRASSFTEPGSGQRLDNGQHALFGCYRETYDFLRVIGTADLAPLDSTLRLAMADVHGRSSTLRCPRWRSPLHLAAGIMGWDAVPLRDRLAAGRLGGLLWSARREGAEAVAARVSPHLTVTQWLRDYGQPSSLCDWLWNPLALAALNQDPGIAAARPFVRVLAELFGPSPSASSLGVPSVPLDELYAGPAARFIETHGGAIRRRVSARVRLGPTGSRHRVVAGDDVLTPRAVISAVPWHAFGRLWTAGVPSPLAEIGSAAAAVQSAPIVTVNLWFDRPIPAERQLGLVGTQFHWAFPKKTSGVFSVEKDTRRLFQKPQEGAGSSTLVPSGLEKDTRRLFLTTVVASGAEGLLRRGNDELAALAERDLRACLPGAAGAVCVRALVVREARATFSLAPGAPARPGTETPVPGFFLAGDWTDTGLPGTIEGGVLSGHRAAGAAMIIL